MKEFTYTIEDELGIHARPAGLLSKLAKSFPDTLVTVTKGDKTVKASQLMKLMNMGFKRGDEVTVAAEGAEEDMAIAALRTFFEENL
ncbi:HPr family phosphocarrier protein [uncultured Oscillibacter sp.]|uniref:HPr family phosphocarrier protein n=1 Tax=uncultured Oscillibacter sp. TaxID=876091 RepID=UPI002617560F|nr:HPr family phosphocarrier protein [uncultured Oscillibacter sp.]